MALTILQYLILGIVQGITEWLPVSSSGVLTLILSNVFQITDVKIILSELLFLHLGTFLAAAIYFRKDVSKLMSSLFRYRTSDRETKLTLNFLIVSTIITAVIGLIILQILTSQNLELTGKTITFVVGLLLFFTGIFQVKIKTRGIRKEINLKRNDGIILGLMQGLSVLPGLSRSGVTISALLLKKFDDTSALRLSFLMSLPVVLFGNLLLNWNQLGLSGAAIYGLLASFVFGLITIHGLMKFSRKINFGGFIIIFAALMMLSVLI